MAKRIETRERRYYEVEEGTLAHYHTLHLIFYTMMMEASEHGEGKIRLAPGYFTEFVNLGNTFGDLTDDDRKRIGKLICGSLPKRAAELKAAIDRRMPVTVED